VTPLDPDPRYPDEYMCPNCVTPWKCNGPHLADDEPWPTYPPERSHWPYLRPGEAAGLIVVGLVALAAGLFAVGVLWLGLLYRRGGWRT
jgi:hypothetical protein